MLFRIEVLQIHYAGTVIIRHFEFDKIFARIIPHETLVSPSRA